MRSPAVLLIVLALVAPLPGARAAAALTPAAAPVTTVASTLNPRLVEVEHLRGTIVGVSKTSILYRDTSTPPRLAVKNRGSGLITLIPLLPGKHFEYGWLTPRGAVVTAAGDDIDSRHLYEWSGGASLVDLGPTDPYDTVAVQGSFVIWGNLGTIFRRNLATDTTAVVARDAVDRAAELLANGDVVYWTTDNGIQGKFKIMSYHGGNSVQLTHDATLSDVFPVADGSNVVYSKIAVVGNSGHTTWLYNGTSHTQIATGLFTDLERFGGYEVAGGWTAYLRPAAPSPQVWLRSPAGLDRRLSAIGDSDQSDAPAVLAVNSSGETLYSVADTLFLASSNQAPVPLATGVGDWTSHRLTSATNFGMYLNGQWTLAIGGSLFLLSAAPPVNLSLTVEGHETVTVNPYGLVCRSSCTLPFAPGAKLNLAVVADLPGWTFGGWSGACSGFASSCDLQLAAASSVRARSVAGDTSAPITTSPVTALPIGTRLTVTDPPAVPLRTSWTTVGPDDPVAANELSTSIGSGPFTPTGLSSVAAQTALTNGISGTRYQFRARAKDTNGHVGQWTSGAPFTVVALPPTDLTYDGTWSFTSPAGSWLGTAASTSDPTAATTASVTGQEVAIVARSDRNLAALAIYVDDQLRQVVPTAYPGASTPRIVADVTLGGGTHTIRVARAASSTAGLLEVQGVIVLR